MNIRRIVVSAVAAFVCVFAANDTRAATTVTYTVDPSQSSLTLSGTYEGFALQPFTWFPADPYSLTTEYSGTITTQRDYVLNTLQITGASIIAQNYGGHAWPSSSPVNYAFAGPQSVFGGAGLITGDIADFAFSLRGPTIGTPATFDVSKLAGTIISGETDYGTGLLAPSSALVIGSLTFTPASASLVGTAADEILTIPVNTDFTVVLTQIVGSTPQSLDLHLSGTIVAAVPEPSSLALLGGAIIFLSHARRRRICGQPSMTTP